MDWKEATDASLEQSILVVLARLKKAGKMGWMKDDEVAALLDRLKTPTSKHIANALIRGKGTLSAQEQDGLSYVQQLAGLD